MNLVASPSASQKQAGVLVASSPENLSSDLRAHSCKKSPCSYTSLAVAFSVRLNLASLGSNRLSGSRRVKDACLAKESGHIFIQRDAVMLAYPYEALRGRRGKEDRRFSSSEVVQLDKAEILSTGGQAISQKTKKVTCFPVDKALHGLSCVN